MFWSMFCLIFVGGQDRFFMFDKRIVNSALLKKRPGCLFRIGKNTRQLGDSKRPIYPLVGGHQQPFQKVTEQSPKGHQQTCQVEDLLEIHEIKKSCH